jgi:hypothetical protein
MWKVLVLSALIASGSAHAKDFQTQANEIAEICDFAKGTCKSTFTIKRISRATKGNSALFKKLDHEASMMARIWGDTILEGDYHAFGDTEAGKVFAIYKGAKLIGYHMEYYEAAMDTSGQDCNRDEEPAGTSLAEDKWDGHFGQCTFGRIYEGGFLSPDLSESAEDYSQLATFFASPKEKASKGFER